MPLPPQSSPPAISAPAPTGPEAQEALLEAFDWGHSLPLMPKELKGQAALRYQWLRRAATFDPAGGLPTGPFLSGRERQEGEGPGPGPNRGVRSGDAAHLGGPAVA